MIGEKCFSGVANSPKQRLITLVTYVIISGLLLDLSENKASFSSFIKTICNGNLVHLESV